MNISTEYILTHQKDYNLDLFPKDYGYDKVYTITDNSEVKADIVVKNERLTSIYGEFPIWQYIVANQKDDEYVTLDHYRRKMQPYFYHDNVANTIMFNCSLYEQTAYYHGTFIADNIDKVLNDKEKQIYHSVKFIVPYNIMHLCKGTATAWVNYIETKLKAMETNLNSGNIITQERALELVKNSDAIKEQPGKDCRPEYQARALGGSAVERFSTIFWQLCNNYFLGNIQLLENGQKI